MFCSFALHIIVRRLEAIHRWRIVNWRRRRFSNTKRWWTIWTNTNGRTTISFWPTALPSSILFWRKTSSNWSFATHAPVNIKLCCCSSAEGGDWNDVNSALGAQSDIVFQTLFVCTTFHCVYYKQYIIDFLCSRLCILTPAYLYSMSKSMRLVSIQTINRMEEIR